MQVGFDVITYKSGPRGALYALHFHDRENPEIDRFLSREAAKEHDEYEDLVAKLLAQPEIGFTAGWRLKARKYRDKGWVRPLVKKKKDPELRLYCIEIPNSSIIILGGGCVKDKGGPLQDYPNCKDAYDRVLYADTRIGKRMRERRISIDEHYHRLVGRSEREFTFN